MALSQEKPTEWLRSRHGELRVLQVYKYGGVSYKQVLSNYGHFNLPRYRTSLITSAHAK
jgi:hypothetical protein